MRSSSRSRSRSTRRKASSVGERTYAAGSYRSVLVEDEATFRRVMAPNLSGRGLLVREVGTADEAVSMPTADRPDLMLLDINLPDRSGWDVMRELRRLGIDVPTIVVSAVRVSQSRLEEFNPTAYLPKPFCWRRSSGWSSGPPTTNLVGSYCVRFSRPPRTIIVP